MGIQNCMKRFLPESYKKARDDFEVLNSKLDLLQGQINNTMIQLAGGPNRYWSNEYERNFVRECYGVVMDEADFRDKYLKLIKSLDVDSIEVINRIILRQKRF